MEDFDEAVEAGREASRHHRKHQQRLFGRHRNSFRLPSSVGWDLLLQVVPFCMFCGSNQRHWMPLLICGSLWRRQSRRDPSRKRPSNQQRNSFVLHEVVRNKKLRSCFLFSEIAVQRPYHLLYIFSSASVGENIPKPARLHLFLGCRHRQAAGGRESFFLPPEGLFFIARHQIEPFLHIYCKIFCRIFQLFL